MQMILGWERKPPDEEFWKPSGTAKTLWKSAKNHQRLS
jgi:hypothetical protein